MIEARFDLKIDGTPGLPLLTNGHASAPIFCTASAPSTQLPKVAVIILDYNGLLNTIECLNSLRELRYGNLAVYVIDNASENDNALAVRELFPDVVAHRNVVNLGFGGGANQAAALAIEDGAQYLLFLNNDATVPGDMLTKLVNAMEQDQQLGICGPAVLHYPGDRVQNLGFGYNYWLGWPNVIGANKRPSWRPRRQHDIAWVMGCALLCRSSVFQRVGGFDHDFFLYWEDHYLCWSAKRLGYKVRVVDDATVIHRKTVGSEFSKRHVYHMFLGQITFAAKTAKWFQKPTLVFGMSAIALAYSVLGLIRQGSFVAPVIYQAVADFYTGHPKRHVIFHSLRKRFARNARIKYKSFRDLTRRLSQ